MRERLPLIEDPIPTVCRKLRTKGSFGAVVSNESAWQTGDSTTAVYWCLVTMETFGPDDDYVDARRCRMGRECFENERGR